MGTGGVVLASPVRQDPQILGPVLDHWARLRDIREIVVYDDNDDPLSREMLQASGATILPRLLGLPPAPYRRWAETHYWTKPSFIRLTRIKNALLDYARASLADLFLVDSDVLVHPQTVTHLRRLDLPIVSEVFWTQWQTGLPYLPQTWDVHPGGFTSRQSVVRLKTPGQYPVVGLGACTYIRHDALEGLSFDPIPGLPYLGEDRPFCVRAGALGIPLAVDTCVPALHLYRDGDLHDTALWNAGRWIDDRLTPAWERQIGEWMQRMLKAHDIMHLQGGTEPWVTECIVSLAQAIQANHVLELGVLRGETTVALARVARHVTGVDVRLTSAAVNRVQEYANIRLIEGNSAEVVQTLAGPFDLVYIDAGHQYADVKADTDAVWEKVSPKGLLLYHDALSPEDNFGVQRFLNERFLHAVILQTRPFPWTGPTGLGIVQR